MIDCVLFRREIGKNLIIPGGTRSIDARGKYIMPGESIVIGCMPKANKYIA